MGTATAAAAVQPAWRQSSAAARRITAARFGQPR